MPERSDNSGLSTTASALKSGTASLTAVSVTALAA